MLRFERRARVAVLPRFGHGRYVDLWSLLHVSTGVTLGMGALLFGFAWWPGLAIALVLSFAYEALEAMLGIAEDVENALADTVCVALGFGVAYLCSAILLPILPLAFSLFLAIDLFVLFMGWRAYLRRRLRRGTAYMQSSGQGPAARRSLVLFLGLAVASIPVPIFAAVDHKAALTWFVFVCLAVAYTLYRRNVGQELVVAFLFALFMTSYNTYVYDTVNIFVGRINIYPLILWVGGLVVLREIYERMRIPYRWFVISVLYVVTLFLVEYVGYYLLGIRTTSHLPSLWQLGVIHGSLFIHWSYLLAGPLYLLVTDYLRVR